MDTKFKVLINKGPDFDGISIWLVEDLGGGKFSVAKPIDFTFVTTEDTGNVKPTIKLNSYFAQEFLRAWGEALKKEKISIEDTFKLEGEINATKYHLEDMRKLVFGLEDHSHDDNNQEDKNYDKKN